MKIYTMENSKSCERLEKLIEWSGMSMHAFAMRIGMKKSENLYRIMRNNENINRKLAELIFDVYPQISWNWLMMGKGDMLNNNSNCSDMRIPFYDGLKLKPLFYMTIPIFEGADRAVGLSDKAMLPLIPANSILIMKKQTFDEIVFDRIYFIETNCLSMVRIIRKSDLSDDELILEAANIKHCESVIIKRAEIVNLHLILGTLNKF